MRSKESVVVHYLCPPRDHVLPAVSSFVVVAIIGLLLVILIPSLRLANEANNDEYQHGSQSHFGVRIDKYLADRLRSSRLARVIVWTNRASPWGPARFTNSPDRSITPEGAEHGRSSGLGLSAVTIQTCPARARILSFDSWYFQTSSDNRLPFRPPLMA